MHLHIFNASCPLPLEHKPRPQRLRKGKERTLARAEEAFKQGTKKMIPTCAKYPSLPVIVHVHLCIVSGLSNLGKKNRLMKSSDQTQKFDSNYPPIISYSSTYFLARVDTFTASCFRKRCRSGTQLHSSMLHPSNETSQVP
jgi:hypothetical protein